MAKRNFIDKVIGFVSPQAGLVRASARAKLEIVSGKRSYDGATQGRRGDGWNSTGNQTQNNDIQRSLIPLRDRSIDAYKNNPNVFKAIRTTQNNVVGTGIMPTVTVASGERKLTKQEIAKIKSKWEWFEENADFEGDFNFYGLQAFAMRTLAMQGEVFVLRQREAKNPVPFKLQILAPHMCDITKNTLISVRSEGNYVTQGIEFDSRGRRVGYWMHEYNPTNEFVIKLSPKFVPAEDVLHVFYKEFPGQVRGVPFGTSGMLNARDLSDYEDAALMSAKVAACHVAFTTQPKPDNDYDPDNYEAEGNPDHLEPGAITYLNPGEEVTFNTPPTPASFSEYTGKMQQKGASAWMLTYEQYTGDLGNVNFSSGRMGWIDSGKNIEDLQYNVFIPKFCNGVWNWFVEGITVLGDIAPGRKVKAEWTPQGREMLDPVKEMNGLILELKTGLVSWTEACKRRGYNPDVLMEQIKADKEMFAAAGVNVEWIIEAAATDTAKGDSESGSDAENLKRIIDAYGVGVRAGTITPTPEDEAYFRNLAQFPEMGEAALAAWKEEGNIRRPITITPLPAEESGIPASESNPDN